MPHALVLNSASKANTTGGTFADTLTANSGDTLAIANFVNGGARIVKMWGIDSDSVAKEIAAHGTVLFLEDMNEKPYRIDRMLVQLARAGKLRDVHGIIFGEMLDCEGSIGGFNFQWAWSTGHVAGKAAARSLLQDGARRDGL